MRPAFKLEPKYSVTVLTGEERNRGPRTSPEVKELIWIWFTDYSRTVEGTGAVVYGQSLGRRLSISLGMYATIFQAEVYAILVCVYEIQTQVRPKKSVSNCSDSHAALKALQAAKTTSPLVYLLTPWCIVLLEKLTGLQLVKKFPAFHGTRRFITALTSFRHLSLSWASPIQSIYPHPTSWRSILILSTHLRLGLPSVLFPSSKIVDIIL